MTETNARGEYTGADGKLYHKLATDTGTGFGEMVHEGEWLKCDGCNPVVVVSFDGQAPPDLTLIDLRGRYDVASAAAKKAEEELKAVKGKLQTALSEASGGAPRARLTVPGFKDMTLTYSEPWTVDTGRLKAEQPLVYVEYAKQGQRWTLAESRGK